MSADESHGKIVTMVARFTAVYPLGSMGIAPAKLLYKYLRDAELKLVRRCGDLQRSIKRLARHGRNVVKDRLWMLRRFRGGFVYTFEIAADLHAAIKDERVTAKKMSRQILSLRRTIRELLDCSAWRERVQAQLARELITKTEGGTPLATEEIELARGMTKDMEYSIGDGGDVLKYFELRNMDLDKAARIEAIMDTGVSLFPGEE